MKKITTLFILLFIFGIYGTVFSKELPRETTEKIITEVNQTFEKAIEAGEKLNVDGVAENVNDVYKTGFISNGVYFDSFDQFMTRYRAGVSGLRSQEMNVEKKKITVLSEDNALLTADGNFNAILNDGRNISGKFAWTFIYSKIDGEWKVIHSHMSNPR